MRYTLTRPEMRTLIQTLVWQQRFPSFEQECCPKVITRGLLAVFQPIR
jgi:hypothetical protein